jgi:hypothetical protein
VRVAAFGDVAAVISPHPVQRLMPSRNNVEPHHRVVRDISSRATLVPAAFGHISETEADILNVLRANHDEIRGELERLDGKCEVGLKLSWTAPNIFDYMVRTNRELRELRDRVFRSRQPSMNEKLQVGSMFEATLTRERERLSAIFLGALAAVLCDTVTLPPRAESTICQAALLIERARGVAFAEALRDAAKLFDTNFAVEYSGPWPPYSFVKLRLQPPQRQTAA